jgi:hypothetical protein
LLLLDLLTTFTLGSLFSDKTFVLTIIAIKSLFSKSLLLLLLSKDIKIALSALIWRLGYNKNSYSKESRNFALFKSDAKILF